MDSESLYKRVGVFIRTRRNQLGYKQEDLARRVGISRASLANIETGRQSLLLHHLYALAKELDLHPSKLLPAVASTDGASKDALPLPSNLKLEEEKDVRVLFAGPLSDSLGPSEKERRSAKQAKR